MKANDMACVGCDLKELARSFPEEANSFLLDQYLVDREEASARIFRVYRAVPAHYHAGSDEFLFVLSGTGTFWMEDPTNLQDFRSGSFLFFRKRVIHALPEIRESPVVFLSIDVPRRNAIDVIFTDASDASSRTFIQEIRDI